MCVCVCVYVWEVGGGGGERKHMLFIKNTTIIPSKHPYKY